MVWLSNFLIFASRSYCNAAMKHATCLRNCNAACLRKCNSRIVDAAKYIFDEMLLIHSTKNNTAVIIVIFTYLKSKVIGVQGINFLGFRRENRL